MNRRYIKLCLLAAVILLIWYAAVTLFAWNERRIWEYTVAMNEPHDVIDTDFTATIKRTDNPLEFIVEVSRVNNDVDKTISAFPTIINLIATRESSTAHTPSNIKMPQRALELDEGFHSNRLSAVTSLKGRIRLVRRGLTPGVYSVKPYVRIVETGKDRVINPRTKLATVTIPAANSIKVTIK